ncbi:MAG: CAP domain-containing protein [Myxococcaceae bacterium]|nr:CAP domain-containing protein [Myxococcaceae bacterium]
MISAVPLIAITLAATTVATPPAELEQAARRRVALAFEAAGRRTPVLDDALSRAARTLAQVALDEDAHAAAELVRMTAALSEAGAFDPSPRVLVVKGAPATAPIRMLEERSDLASEPASHLGVGAALGHDGSAVILLFAQRRALLEPFARRFDAPPGVRPLCGELTPPLGSPDVAVTLPDGSVQRPQVTRRGQSGFCAPVPLQRIGRYTVEVLGRGPKGPQVAALFFVTVGAAAPKDTSPLGPEPKDAASARAAILERMNALRRAHGRKPLAPDEKLDAVAQAYSEQMARGHFFAHVSPAGDSVGQRLKAAGYPYRAAGENLGSASGPLAAHFGIEHSPGHRRNLLDDHWSRVGIGVAPEQTDAGLIWVVTEIFVDPLDVSEDPLADAYRAIAARRAALKLPKLSRNPVLERLATAHARRALQLGEPRADLPGGNTLHQQIFDALEDVKRASVDFFVADDPALIDATRATADPKFSQVGIGAVKGDSPRFGKDKYWMVVIYAAE